MKERSDYKERRELKLIPMNQLLEELEYRIKNQLAPTRSLMIIEEIELRLA